MQDNSAVLNDAGSPLIRARLRTPRAAAIAGIVFWVLLISSLWLLRLAVPSDPLEAGAWLGPVGHWRWRAPPCCLPLHRKRRHPELVLLRGSILGPSSPLSTLRPRPRGLTRMTRGRCGSLCLHRKGLAPSPFCRSPGAPVQKPNFEKTSGRSLPSARRITA